MINLNPRRITVALVALTLTAGGLAAPASADAASHMPKYKLSDSGKHVTVGEWEGREPALEAWARGHERWRQQRGVTLQSHAR